MSWVGLHDATTAQYNPAGLGRASSKPVDLNSILPTGTLMLCFASDPAEGTQTLISYKSTSPWSSGLTLTLSPSGLLELTQWQGDRVCTYALQSGLVSPADEVMVTYSWNAPARTGMISLLVADTGQHVWAKLSEPVPMSLRDGVWMMSASGRCTMTRGLGFAAISDTVTPHGPWPTLAGETLIPTVAGPMPLSAVKSGQLVQTADGGIAQIRWVGSTTLPARGRMAPLRLRAPYHGAARDLVCAADQRLRVAGPHVEYLFAAANASLSVGDLTHGVVGNAGPQVLTQRYWHFLLDRPVPINVGGLLVEGLDASLLLRDPGLRAASVLAGLPAELLPKHATDGTPRLRSFETLTWCNLRAA
jgi:hypothetical protein